MALPDIQITPVNIGAVADDGTGDKLRVAVGKLNSSIASLAEVMTALTLNADPELDTFRKVADIIYVWNTIINGLPTPQQVIDLIEAEAAPAVAAIPTPAQVAAQVSAVVDPLAAAIPTPASVEAMIAEAAADVVAELSPTNFYTKGDTDALLAALKGTADAAHDTLGELAALIDANTAAIGTNTAALATKADLALVHAMTLAR